MFQPKAIPPPKPPKKENAPPRWAPVKGLAAVGYVGIRFVHLALMVSVMPLAWFFLQGWLAEEGISVPEWLGWASIIPLMLWALMYLGLGEFGFPISFRGAVWVGLLTLSNFMFGGYLCASDWLFGGYLLLISGFASQILFLGTIWVFGFFPFMREKGWPEVPSLHRVALPLLFGSQMLVFAYLCIPFLHQWELADEMWRVFLLATLGFQIQADWTTLRNGSVVGDQKHLNEPLRWDLWGRWMAMTLPGIIGLMVFWLLVAAGLFS